MRTLLARQLRTVFGVILAAGVLTLPQASWAQAHQVSGHPAGIKVFAISGGNGVETATLAEWNLQRQHVWMRLVDVFVMSGTLTPPLGFKPRTLEVIQKPVE